MAQAESLAVRLARLPKEAREEVLTSLSADQLVALRYDWAFWARPGQLPPPGEWDVWLLSAGRGYGKTRTGAEMVNMWARDNPIIHLVGRTAGDVRDIMIEGESGILACAPPWFRPSYNPSLRRVTWPNGAKALVFTSAEPEELRGPQAYKAWADEPATWGKTPKRGLETWTNMMLGLRLGPAPQVIATTTPKNTPLIRMLLEMADPARREAARRAGRETLRVVLTTGSTYENIHNLPPSFIQNIVQQYEGTRIGQQELHAVLLSDDPRALWKRARIDELRVEEAPPLRRVCVGVDPSGSVGEHASACGIVAAGEGDDGHFYVLADATLVGTPAQWGATVIALYEQLRANAIVAEKNFGGLMVEHTILSMADPGRPRPKVELVVSSRGKYLRAEPVSVLYEQHPGRVHHVGTFPELEDQMVTWVPGERSPDRLDALVFAITWLLALDRPRYMAGARPYGIF